MKILALPAVVAALSFNTAFAEQRDTEVTLESGVTMIFQRDVSITLRDGHIVYANVYRPKKEGRHPVILAQTIYGKDPNFGDAYKARFDELKREVPELCRRSSCNFIKWEVTDPERWLPEKYAVMIVDVRGSGKSPGLLDSQAPRETFDFYDVIEWAGTEPWSNGKVGLLGSSYLAMNQWQVAALQPPHLAAIIPWEGASDWYREATYHGGILSNLFASQWNRNQVSPNAHGNGNTPYRDPDTGEPTTGTALSEYFLDANVAARRVRPLEDEAYKQFTPIFRVSRYRYCLPAIGAAWACTAAATSRAIFRPERHRNGSRCTPGPIMASSITMSASRCRRDSSIGT